MTNFNLYIAHSNENKCLGMEGSCKNLDLKPKKVLLINEIFKNKFLKNSSKDISY